jgi:hypothetical protein
MKLVTIYTKSATLYIKLSEEALSNLEKDILRFDAKVSSLSFTFLKDINNQTVIVSIPSIISLHSKDVEDNTSNNNLEEFQWPATII